MAAWTVLFDPRFEVEFSGFDERVKIVLRARIALLSAYGPSLGRPNVDTLKGSKYANMKELRFSAADGAWRLAFAFDPERRAILLVAGDKSGINQDLFYKTLIARADERFDDYQ